MIPSELPDFAVFRNVTTSWFPEMVVIPAGSFLMGSPEDEEGRDSNDSSQHWEKIEYRFAIGRYPVTFAEYDHFCEVTNREKPEDLLDNGRPTGRGRKPVYYVSWRDAVAYCKWLSMLTHSHYRLPSEAEWEYACRAGTTTRYSWGDAISEKNASYSGISRTDEQIFVDVGSYPPNPWGLYDMHGTVWEWVDGTAGPVMRGGGWSDASKCCRSASRLWNADPDFGDYWDRALGFRVALTLVEPLTTERPANRESWWRRLVG
jgi:formylglycine-generating enzyme required for sulfatase activity